MSSSTAPTTSAVFSASSITPSSAITTSLTGLRVAIVGCSHGELDKMYACVEDLQRTSGRAIDLLICCGDFQSVRNYTDLSCMACPPQHRRLNTFYKYYTGEKKAPVLTIFIGGNHEASNYLVELFHGGWVAPNIYYMGFSSILQFGGLRIGGLSGIHNDRHYAHGHYERAPFDNDSQRSVYHVREFDVWCLEMYEQARKAQQGQEASAASSSSSSSVAVASSTSSTSTSPVDIFLSHDWPRGIERHGNTQQLLRRKKHFASDVASGQLGSPPAQRILHALKPHYWFSAHLHVKFPAVVRHDATCAISSSETIAAASSSTSSVTHFLALDKCVAHRDYMQLLDFPDAVGEKVLAYDPIWLAVLRNTHPYLNLQRGSRPLPKARNDGRPIVPTMDEIRWIHNNVPRSSSGLHAVPHNFVLTADGWREGQSTHAGVVQPFIINPQTSELLKMLQLEDRLTPAYSAPSTGRHGSYQQQQQQQHSPQAQHLLPHSHISKKQRMSDETAVSSIATSAPPVHTNPDEIDLDSDIADTTDATSTAPSDSAHNQPQHNPEEIALEDI